MSSKPCDGCAYSRDKKSDTKIRGKKRIREHEENHAMIKTPLYLRLIRGAFVCTMMICEGREG
jgi:hypothetical protein